MRYFPEPDDPELAPFTRAFVKVMFAHAELEHRISDLLECITREPGFGEKPCNRMPAQKRPELVRKLCAKYEAKHPGGLPETDEIVRLLSEAFPLCNERNLLAHGIWWALDSAGSFVTVRPGTAYENKSVHRDFYVSEIENVAFELGNLEAELYKLQASIEVRSKRGEDSMTISRLD